MSIDKKTKRIKKTKKNKKNKKNKQNSEPETPIFTKPVTPKASFNQKEAYLSSQLRYQ